MSSSTSVWDDLVGQDETVAVLQSAAVAAADIAHDRPVATGAMTHAWLFTGPPGSGRSVAARAFAAALECERGGEPDSTSSFDSGVAGAAADGGGVVGAAADGGGVAGAAADGGDSAGSTRVIGCGECSACRTVRARTHPDVRSVVPEGLSISVADMRAVVAIASRRPALGRWQVVVIEDADRLTEQASNALLKAIEEPPPRTVFLLCAPSTHPDDVSLTVRSRCRLITLRTPPADAVAGVLERGGLDRATAQWAAAAGQGHIGRSRRLVRDDAARARRAEVLAIPAALTSLRACLEAADQLVGAAEAEAAAMADELDAGETSALQTALGAGGTGKGAATAARGMAGAIKDLEKRQKSRATRAQRDALDRALVDLAAFYRDVLLVHARSPVAAAHPDFDDDVRAVALRVDAPGVLQRLDAVLACREALELNVKPRIAVEAMTAALLLP